MKILVLLNQPYPKGFALTKRMHLYANGFIANNENAKILIPIPRENQGEARNDKCNGIFDNVEFEYAWKSCERSKYFFIRRFHDFFGYLYSGIIILKYAPNVIITTRFSSFFYLYIKIISLCISSKFIIEKCEVDNLENEKLTKIEKFKIKFIHQLFDGIIVITKQLEEYHRNELKLKTPIINIPILIDCNVDQKIISYTKTIVYTGTYLERKDGILTIIKAFSKFVREFHDYKLIMTGNPASSNDYLELIELIKKEKINNNIIFTGYLSEKDLRTIINSATLLIIAKPFNRQNYYNFPTKLAEYLMSERPILSTSVGVIGDTLSDQKNIFFEEFDFNKFADKMKFIVNNEKFANEVGKNGKQYAIQNFNHIKQIYKLINFFKSI